MSSVSSCKHSTATTTVSMSDSMAS